ncbi:hypothetical protein [Conexibacter woesei]|uniref:Uncharacterized protein n=1 Tax=Conexibacter woesei (strain DSM 14684 / CCUG 47730 / CIP 108061 / JCM 11494 / NBRC 100937 / ID131577) TaxID=469383 RepID=D3F197_CONWI|nr:hypothetical protein [Conexibacter woesei]ADB52060.1 hypothetical protein Cwoe_3643 [Conexibacter woesei DSM 14684]
MIRHRRLPAGAAGTAVLVAVLAAASAATAATSAISGKVTPDHGAAGTPLSITIGFTLDPEPAGQSMTLSTSELKLPSNGVLNSRLFPTCNAATINARRGRFTDCPRGSQVGRGSFSADVPAADVFGVPGRVTIFNGGGTNITVHIYATNPVLISEAFDAQLVRTSGRYGYSMNIRVPDSMQEISDGWFAELRRFTATVGATAVVRGRRRGYVEAKRCPKSGRAPIAATFGFLRESAPTSAVGWISCRP